MSHSIEQMPKIELHCHLDGSLDLANTRELLAERGEEYDIKRLAHLMQVDDDCRSLADYLERFTLPNHCLQDAEGLKSSAYWLARNAASENVKYLEVRFAPAFSMGQGLSTNQIIESVEAGLAKARAEFDIETGIIVCMMRGFVDDENNLKMVRAAREMLGSGVVACDIAGDEDAHPMALQTELFNEVKRLGMPYTIHAGETGNIQNVRDAIALGTKRLGHGIAMANDVDLMNYCSSHKIGVELCPTSNIQTRAYDDIKDCPISIFMERGIPVSLNTDNRTVSNTNLTKEFNKIVDAFGFDEEQLKTIYINSVEMSFASDEVKNNLINKWR